MDTITASCPECGAQYELTQEQLSVANGQVRCGACMTIFQAVPPAPVEEAPVEDERALDRSEFVNDDDDMLISDTGVRDSFDDVSEFETGEYASDFNDLDDGLGNLDDGLGDFDDSLLNDELGELGIASADSDDSSSSTDESWAEQLLDEEDEGISDDSVEESPGSDDKPKQALGTSADDFDFDDLEGFDDDALVLSESEEEELGITSKDDMLGRITPEPLEFKMRDGDPLWLKAIFGILCLVALAGFGSQVFYFQFETLARDNEWRGFYQSACNQLGCELPEQFSIEDISANNLTVKSHPYFNETLIVDAIITNHAEIAQPFPNIELFFTNLDQKIIAARKFTPSDYLRGELANAELMPNRQPIHMALELNDPGTDATGYWIQLTY